MSRERERLEEIARKIKRESDHQYQVGSSSSSPGINTITPCAACKLLRRRCAQECPFSPYFSPHEPQKFAAVHRVFGASNVSKMLMEVPESHRGAAANSLVYEASVRLRDPVYGCMGAISKLQHQVQALTAELSLVRAQIVRFQFDRENFNNSNNNNLVINNDHDQHNLDHGTFSDGNFALLTSCGGDGRTVSDAAPPPPPPLPANTSSHSMYCSSPSSAPDFSSISDDNEIPFYG